MEVEDASDEIYFHKFIKENGIEWKPAKSKVARLAQSLAKQLKLLIFFAKIGLDQNI